uniref:Putative transporter n=1 Tax=Diffractella curvata TaxID=2819868 RepID=A0A7R6TIU5_9PEZI|nr:ZopL6 [Diffractella curvata]BBU42020.1 putative transporter [Diffractella curvata]
MVADKLEVLDGSTGPPMAGNTEEEPYSTFTVGQKRWIIGMVSFAGFFSPLSSSIYFPALPTIAKDLSVTSAQINLTVTTYLIIQGVAPMVVASFSDVAGRRPAYILCFALYLAANLGLSLQNSYPALLGLRCLQSAGSSGTISLANGVVSDLVTSSERGKFISLASAGTILGPTLAPIIGGLLTQYLEWHWLFWLLFILAGAFAIPFLLFTPETSRVIVGNGSISPPFLNSCLTDVFRRRKLAKTEHRIRKPERPRMQVPNLLKSLSVIANLETVLVLLPAGFSSAALQAVLTDASKEFTETYRYNTLQVSLMFIPIGVGGLLSVLFTGKLVDWNYRRHAKRLGLSVNRNKSQDMADFPLERARLELSIPIFILLSVLVIVYGWIMTQHVNISGPIIILFILGYAMIAVYQILSVLLVDIHPGQAATASAANNLIRCELGAAFAAFIAPMIDGIGTGWSYTILALAVMATVPGLLVTMRCGILWRKQKAARETEKQGEKDGQSARVTTQSDENTA